MLNRLMDESPIKFDKQQTVRSDLILSTAESTRNARSSAQRTSPIKLQKMQTATESPGKTFDLTQTSQSIEVSPKKALRVGSKRMVSLNNSREIIRASKHELVQQLVSPKTSNRLLQ